MYLQMELMRIYRDAKHKKKNKTNRFQKPCEHKPRNWRKRRKQSWNKNIEIEKKKSTTYDISHDKYDDDGDLNRFSPYLLPMQTHKTGTHFHFSLCNSVFMWLNLWFLNPFLPSMCPLLLLLLSFVTHKKIVQFSILKKTYASVCECGLTLYGREMRAPRILVYSLPPILHYNVDIKNEMYQCRLRKWQASRRNENLRTPFGGVKFSFVLTHIYQNCFLQKKNTKKLCGLSSRFEMERLSCIPFAQPILKSIEKRCGKQTIYC